MPHKSRYDELAIGVVEAAERGGGTMLDFCHGLKDIKVAIEERLEMAVSELEPEQREEWELTK